MGGMGIQEVTPHLVIKKTGKRFVKRRTPGTGGGSWSPKLLRKTLGVKKTSNRPGGDNRASKKKKKGCEKSNSHR